MNSENMSNKMAGTDIKPTEAFSDRPLPEEMVEINQFGGMNRFMILIIAMAMIPWIFGSYVIFGFNVTGWAWVIAAVVASLVCLTNPTRIAFPFILWLPWSGLLCLYWFFGRHNPDALQSLLQTLSPLAVGCAASIFRPGVQQLDTIIRWITRLSWIVWILLLIRVPIIMTGVLPGHGFMTAEMIGLLLLGACYASFYACGSSRHLYYYLSIMAITVISLTRGPIVAMLSCLPLTLGPLTTRKRLIFFAAVAVCSIIIFNSERVQQIMFFSGSGSLSDLYWDNPNLQTSGRSFMFDILWPGVEARPLLGNGWNTHRTMLLIFGVQLYLPHNDWLKLLYDTGIAGTGLYLVTMILQLFALIKIARSSSGAHQMLAFGAATAFIPYALIMLTDNVILYVQFFGNLHFALIGIIYGVLQRDNFKAL